MIQGAKVVERSHRAARGDREKRAPGAESAATAGSRCPVEIPVRTLDQRRAWRSETRKAVKGCQSSSQGDLENRAIAIVHAVGSARGCRPIQVPVAALHQRKVGLGAVRADA